MPRTSRREKNTPEKLAAAVRILQPAFDANRPISSRKYAKQHPEIGSHTLFDFAKAFLRGLAEAKANPEIDRAILSKSAQEKFDSAVRQYKKKLDAEYKELARRQAVKILEETMLPATQRRHAEYSAVIKARRGALSEREFRVLLRVAHPDTRASASAELLREAYAILEARKLVLVAEKENPTAAPKIPTTDDVMRGWR